MRLSIVLILTIAPAVAWAQPAESQVCHPIRRGESATQAARRLTGDGWNAYQTWFQVLNRSSRAVPKSQYNRIRPGWLACVTKPPVQRASADATRLTAAEASRVPGVNAASEAVEAVVEPIALAATDAVKAADDSVLPLGSDIAPAIESVDLTMLLLGAAMVVPWLGWRVLDDYLARRKTTSIIIGYFAQRFVDEFERPLVRDDVRQRPVQSRFRRGRRRGRFEILLAPGDGRRYPNLSDHKKNVEYDVARVMHVLADDSFASGRPYMQAGWVVLPFQFKAGRKQPGATCISSF